MTVIRFYVDIEVDDEELPNEVQKQQILNEMEEVVGKRGYSLYDSGTEAQED